MKTMKNLILGLFIFMISQACTPKMTFTNSTVAPAATGKVTVRKDKNNNYVTNVNVLNLALAKNLTPAKNTYLVWMETNDSSVSKLGQLTPSGRALEGRLSATTVAKPNQIFITAEDNADIQNPEGQVILTTRR